jgi:hypothetical protein
MGQYFHFILEILATEKHAHTFFFLFFRSTPAAHAGLTALSNQALTQFYLFFSFLFFRE